MLTRNQLRDELARALHGYVAPDERGSRGLQAQAAQQAGRAADVVLELLEAAGALADRPDGVQPPVGPIVLPAHVALHLEHVQPPVELAVSGPGLVTFDGRSLRWSSRPDWG